MKDDWSTTHQFTEAILAEECRRRGEVPSGATHLFCKCFFQEDKCGSLCTCMAYMCNVQTSLYAWHLWGWPFFAVQSKNELLLTLWSKASVDLFSMSGDLLKRNTGIYHTSLQSLIWFQHLIPTFPTTKVLSHEFIHDVSCIQISWSASSMII